MTLRWWPRSLFGRILLVMALGLALAHALTFVLAFTERSMTMRLEVGDRSVLQPGPQA